MTTELTAPAVDDQALDAGLLVHSNDPLNAETPLSALIAADVTPVDQFYVRNHFPVPHIDVAHWRLSVGGRVLRRRAYGLEELRTMRAQTRVVTLEWAETTAQRCNHRCRDRDGVSVLPAPPHGPVPR